MDVGGKAVQLRDHKLRSGRSERLPLDLGNHQLPPAAVQIVLNRLALRGHAVAVHCAIPFIIASC
jgi:hypothetical protein